MSSVDRRELMKLAESFKSFPKAVVAIVLAMFDRGAGQIRISFIETSEGSSDLYITADKAVIRETELHDPRATIWILPHVHHSDGAVLYTDSCDFVDLGVGEGVNPRQDRSARRLVRELPKLLSPSEAYRTVVINADGTEHKLVKSLPSTVIDKFRVSWPERLVGFGREGLILKFGAMRVPMSKFLGRLELDPVERDGLEIFSHPWLQGTIEVESALPEDKLVSSLTADDDDVLYSGRFGENIAHAILQILRGVALREMNKIVNADLQDFCNDQGELKLGDHTYDVKCADESHFWRVEHVVLGYARMSQNIPTKHGMWLNVTHPVFRTIGPDREEIMQVIWWQLAMWIAHHRSVIEKPDARTDAITEIYLALREQNPERWDD